MTKLEVFKMMLQGKKTYIVSTMLVLLAALQLLGIEVPGVHLENPVELLLEGLGLGFLRAGVSKK